MGTGLGSREVDALAQGLATNGNGNGGGNPTPTPTVTETPVSTATPPVTPTIGVTPTPTPTATNGGLISNGGFENGQSPWKESSAGSYKLISTSKPHTGKNSAYLYGY